MAINFLATTLTTVWGIDSRFTQQCNVALNVYADLCSLLAGTAAFSLVRKCN